ncbi:XdhC family protein [Radicibacter daui]|uniref:XdhC family protein n=1 Tax=Radicibacter daui TaxID=3064829 RepID=UPI004046E904
MKQASEIFRFLLAAAERGERTALVTITDVTGGSAREPGTHMAVSETGAYRGSFSGGCIEAALVGEARRVIDAGSAESLRFGAGSPFMDIRLPCGGGIDVLVSPLPEHAVLEQALALLDARQGVLIELGLEGGIGLHPVPPAAPVTGWHGGRFLACHQPDLRLLVVGHGTETLALARIAGAYGAEVQVLSPDQAITDQARALGVPAELLLTPGRSRHMGGDAHTAIVLLFHDHDWEAELLEQALESEAFFIGAMGSRKTQARRLEELRRRGADEAALRRISGPVGLITAVKDPETLALSALAEIIARLEERRQSLGSEALPEAFRPVLVARPPASDTGDRPVTEGREPLRG